jgi:hypothetical protein
LIVYPLSLYFPSVGQESIIYFISIADYLFYFDRDRSGLFYFHTLILFLFILFRSRQEWIILFSYSYFISIATGVGISIIYFGMGYFSVDRSFSVRPNLGRVGFSCGESGEIISLDSE